MIKTTTYGIHKWVCLVSIPITKEEAAIALESGKVDRDVTLKDVEYMGIGCYICEEPLTKELFETVCEGQPE